MMREVVTFRLFLTIFVWREHGQGQKFIVKREGGMRRRGLNFACVLGGFENR